MFQQIQEPFERILKITVPKRKAFLNYNYVIYKICELLKIDLKVKMLKSRDNLEKHDKIWKEIVQKLDLDFIPTI